MQKLNDFQSSAQGRGALAVTPSDHNDIRFLGAGASVVHAIPEGAKYVSFSSNGDFYCRFQDNDQTLIVPNTDVTDGTAPEFNPSLRSVKYGITKIALCAPEECIVQMAFYGR